MRKIQDLALIKSIEITDGLAAYNNENNTLRARLIFAYDSSTDNGDDDVLALLTTLTSTNQYSLIINLDNLPNINGMNDEQITEQAKQLLVGKKTTFTTYIFQIAELNETGETHVHNTNGRVYSSFSNSYLGKMDDDETAKNSILTRLNNGLNNGEYEFGQEIAQQAPQAPRAPRQNTDKAWDIFQQNFDLIHKNFFRNLRTRYPNLTPTDLKFCALLRPNLNTKEIANYTNLSVRGVEGARYRLRKKFGIEGDASLTDFLIDMK